MYVRTSQKVYPILRMYNIGATEKVNAIMCTTLTFSTCLNMILKESKVFHGLHMYTRSSMERSHMHSVQAACMGNLNTSCQSVEQVQQL